MLEGKRIFLVEDDVNSLAIIRSMLKRHKASILYDTWGAASVEKIQKNLPFDLIIMDLNLPRGLTGYDVFAQLKDVSELAQIPVVLVTAADPLIEIPKAQNLGFAGFISKPVRNRTFPYALEKIMKGESIWGKVIIPINPPE